MAGAPKLPQVFRGFLRGPEGDQIAQPLIDGKERYPLSVALSPERGVKLLAAEP